MKSDNPNRLREVTSETRLPELSVLFDGNPLAIWIYDASTLKFLDANESALSQYGYARHEFLQLTLDDILLPARQILSTDQHQNGYLHLNDVHTHVKSDGVQIEVAIRSNDVAYRGRQCKLIVAEDVTERRKRDAKLLQVANHDALTGLPNRALLNERMTQALAAAQTLKHKAAIIAVDLDQFKKVNDRFGHAIGDEYLKHISQLLSTCLRGTDTAARMGGDEFAIMLGEVSTANSAGEVGKLLLRTLNKQIVLGGYTFQPSASLGIALFPDHGADMNELWRCADAAMYRAKRAGGNHCLVADPQPSTPVDGNGGFSHIRNIVDKECSLPQYQVQ